MSKPDEYLQKSVKSILQPMIFAVLRDRPEDPDLYMIKWLQNYSGITTSEENMERAELENLRKEVKKYKKKYETEDKEMEVASESEDNISEEEQEKFDLEIKKKQRAKKMNRCSVSGECYGQKNKMENFVPKEGTPKSPEQIKSIKEKCAQSFIFNALEENDLDTVIKAFVREEFAKGKTVIKQGDNGEVIYLVDEGELDCYKVFKEGEEPKHLKVYQPGDSFGELALLYNTPRAATIKAKTNCVLWSLDRQCFNHIVKGAAIQKREKNEEALKKVELLSTIEPYELSQIADALKSKKVDAKTEIIKQGEEGNEFYILEEGKAIAIKVTEPGKEPEKVMDYETGSFFGELALINNAPRAATVIAESDCKLLYLDRMSFKRLLGPIENLLKKNSEKYNKYMGIEKEPKETPDSKKEVKKDPIKEVKKETKK